MPCLPLGLEPLCGSPWRVSYGLPCKDYANAAPCIAPAGARLHMLKAGRAHGPVAVLAQLWLPGASRLSGSRTPGSLPRTLALPATPRPALRHATRRGVLTHSIRLGCLGGVDAGSTCAQKGLICLLLLQYQSFLAQEGFKQGLPSCRTATASYLQVQDEREHASEVPVTQRLSIHHGRHQVLASPNINDGVKALLHRHIKRKPVVAFCSNAASQKKHCCKQETRARHPAQHPKVSGSLTAHRTVGV